MTPQDAQIIRSVFDRLKTMEATPRDPEAEGLVEALTRADPQAGLALVRALVLTERAREAAAAEATTLRRKIETLEAQGSSPTQAPGGGLFGGPWGSRPAAPAPQQMPQQMPQPDGPWSGRAQQPGPWDAQPPQGGGGSGFWGSALRTGAGVAGGMFAFEALRGLFSGGSHGGGGFGQSAGLFDQPTTVINETVNVFQGDSSGSAERPRDAAWDSGAYDDTSYDDGGGFGGDDDSLA